MDYSQKLISFSYVLEFLIHKFVNASHLSCEVKKLLSADGMQHGNHFFKMQCTQWLRPIVDIKQ